MIWALAGVATVLSCELFCRIPIFSSFLEVKLTASKALRVLKSESISDHWKELVLPKYALTIARCSVLFFLYIVMALCPFLLVGLFSSLIGLNFFNFIFDFLPIIYITVFAWAYLVMRNNFGKRGVINSQKTQ